MKKSLFAIAAVTAFAGAAQAQSSVTVYGVMDGSYTATENKSNTTAAAATTTIKGRNTVNGDGALSTSRIGFMGTEDIGGGTKAKFVLEYDLVNIGNGANGSDLNVGTNTNAASVATTGANQGFGARQSWIGIGNDKAGELRLGRQFQSVYNTLAAGLAGGGNNIAGSIYSSGNAQSSTNSAAVRPVSVFVNQAVTYVSPNVAGFNVELQTSQNAYSASDTTASAGYTESGGNVTYTGMKNLTVGYGLAVQNTTVASVSNVKSTQQALSANYNFGVAQVFALASKIKTEDLAGSTVTRDQTGYEIGVKAPITPVIGVWASAFTGDKKTTADSATLTAATTGRADISGFQLGTTYAFSKRTTAYAIYGSQDVKGKSAATGTKIASQGYALGLRHTF